MTGMLREIGRMGRWPTLVGVTIALLAANGPFYSLQNVLLPGMERDLGPPPTEVSGVTIVALVAPVVCAFPAGLFAARFGARRMVGISLAMLALGELITALASGWPLLGVGRLISNGAGAAVTVGALTIGARSAVPRHGILWVTAAVAAAGVAILKVRDLIWTMLSLEPPNAWRLVAGIAFLLAGWAALVCWPLLREPNRQAEGEVPTTPNLGSVRSFVRRPLVGRLGLIALLGGLVAGACSSILARLFTQRMGSSIGTMFDVQFIAGSIGFAGVLLAGFVANRFGVRVVLMTLVVLQVAVLLLVGYSSVVTSLVPSGALLVLTTWSLLAIVASASGAAAGRTLAPVGVGIVVTALSAGQLCGPWLLALLPSEGGRVTMSAWIVWPLLAVPDLVALVLALGVRWPPHTALDPS